MSKAIISSALRVSDYLDKQAIREKEKRKEKILSILPSFIEQQVSGITDKETLFKTIPRLSADLYAYGPDVGNAANQILGNIAQTKFREIGEIEEKKSYQDIVNIQKSVNEGLKFEGGKTPTDFLNEMQNSNYDPKTIAATFGDVLKANRIQESGVGSVDSKGRPIWTSYEVGKGGKVKQGDTILITEKNGNFYGDKLSTSIEETDPLPAGAIDFYSQQKVKDYEDKKQMNKQLTIQKFAQDYGFAKQEEAFRNQVKKKVFYDMKTGETVKADLDESGSPYFYKEQNEGTTFPGFGTSPDIKTNMGGKKNRIVVNNVSDFQEVGQFPQNTDLKATDLATQKSISNKFLIDAAQKIAQASGYDTDKALSNLYDATGRYFDPERVRTVFDEYVREELDPALQVKYDAGELTQDEIQQLVSSDTIDEKYAEPLIYWQAYRKSQGLYEQKTDVYNQQSQSRLGQQPTTTTKQKLPGWE